MPDSSIPTEINHEQFKQKMLDWVTQFDTFLFLDSNHHPDPFKKYDWILGAGVCDEIYIYDDRDEVDRVSAFAKAQKNKFQFCRISYDYKNNLEKLGSNNTVSIDVPRLHFFVAEWVIYSLNHKIYIRNQKAQSFDLTTIIHVILNSANVEIRSHDSIQVKATCTRGEYLKQVKKMQDHIQRGDIYEANY